MKQILSLTDASSCGLDEVGGKAANLARLIQCGFNVPDGFVVPAGAYRVFAETGDLPAELVTEIQERVGEYPLEQEFAVRSSGTMEDLDAAAFAGLHDTFLEVKGADVARRVQDCFLSLGTPRAVAYRDHRGFDHAQAAMAVVVQPLIPCDRAGVAFSVNAVSGDLSEIIIDANHGLGESVVNGESIVDHFVVDKASCAAKAVHARDERSGPCLNARELGQVAELATRVEAAFLFPQDIEWGFANGNLYVLQTRAITSIAPRWTRDESAERFPIAMTPLTWDFLDNGFHRSLNYSFQLMGFPAFHGQWFASHDHYIYGNQNAVQLYACRPPFRIGSLEELAERLPWIRETFRWVQELPVAWTRNLDHHLVEIGRFSAQDLDRMGDQELWEFVLTVNAHGAEYFEPNIAISITQTRLYYQLRELLKMAIGDCDAARLFPDLTGYNETKTGIINAEIYAMVCQVRANPALLAMIRNDDSEAIIRDTRLAAYPEFCARFEEFLRDHGHREVEFDGYHPTWGDAPWVVLDLFKQLLQHENLENPYVKERLLKMKQQSAECELLSLLPREFHFFFFELLRLTREYTRLDDLEHYQTTRLTLIMRRALITLGRRLVARGLIEEPHDIFFAHEAQVNDAFANSAWGEWEEQVRIQKAAYQADNARSPDWVLGEEAIAVDGDQLSGIPGSGGQAEGEVYLLESAADFATFPKGAILVARTTSPSWTPVFYSAAAVITESGGPLSHGAVTAREVGIPAVMSVRTCMSSLRNGQRVRVNGTHGQVQLV
jgi:rifampicin phosphotransferase